MLFMEDAQDDEKKLVGLVGEKKREIDETSASKILLTYFTDFRERQKMWGRTMSGSLSYFLITKKKNCMLSGNEEHENFVHGPFCFYTKS